MSDRSVRGISFPKKKARGKTRKTMAVCEGVTGDCRCKMLDIIFTPIPTNLASLLRPAICSQRFQPLSWTDEVGRKVKQVFAKKCRKDF